MAFGARLLGVEPAAAATRLLAGDASARRYHRVEALGRSAVVMELPGPNQPAPGLPTTRGRVAPGGVVTEELPFLNVQRYLARAGYPVPGILGQDLTAGLVAIEDLGDLTFEAAVDAEGPAGRLALYRQAIGLVCELQEVGRRRIEGHADEPCVAFRRRFDEPLLRWELEHFREWLLEHGRGAVLSREEGAVVDAGFAHIAATLAALPPVLTHRDFQSRNLMVQEEPGGKTLRVIDFQDALLGPCVYDLVALLRDSYVELPWEEVEGLLADYQRSAGATLGAGLLRHFHLQTVQRKLKDAGRFVFLDVVRGQPGYLAWIPASLRYAAQALAALPELSALREVLARHVPELGTA